MIEFIIGVIVGCFVSRFLINRCERFQVTYHPGKGYLPEVFGEYGWCPLDRNGDRQFTKDFHETMQGAKNAVELHRSKVVRKTVVWRELR